MKKIILFLVMGVLILNIVPAAKFDSNWWLDHFKSNSDKTWQKFEKDPLLWKDSVAVKAAFEINPYETTRRANEEMYKQYFSLENIKINAKNYWMTKDFVNLVSEYSQEDSSILNENLYVKREWFAQKGFIDEGVRIDKFSGNILKSNGSESTTFDLTDDIFQASRLLSSGKLILKDGTEIKGSEISRDEDGFLEIKGGKIDLFSTLENNFKIMNSEVKIGNSFYSGQKDAFVTYSKENGAVKIQGQNVLEKSVSGEIVSKFSGSMKMNGHKVLGESTDYILFSDGKESREYNVLKETAIYSDTNKCVDDSISCVESVGGNLHFVLKDNNSIMFNSFDDSVNNLKINLIEDNSSLIFNDKGNVKLIFNNEPLKIEGNFAKLSSDIQSSFLDKDNKLHNLEIKDNSIIQCSFPCKEFSLNSINGPRLNELLKNSKKREEYQKYIGEKYGKELPVWELQYLIYNGNPAIYKNLISISQKRYEETGIYISPESLYAGMVAEGLGGTVQYGGVEAKDVDGYGTFGLDRFKEDYPALKKYLGSDFKEYPVGEDFGNVPSDGVVPEGYDFYAYPILNDAVVPEKVYPGVFKDLETAFEAHWAEVAWRKDILSKDLKNFGIDENKLSKDELEFWNYVYFNPGPGKGKKMIKEFRDKGYLKNKNYVWKNPVPKEDWAYNPAYLKMVRLKMLEESGVVFPKVN